MLKKFIIIGDLHNCGKELIDNEINKFLLDIFNKYKNEYCYIFLGDVFDNFDLSAKDNLFYSFLQKQNDKTIYLICGNHDTSKNRNSLLVADTFSNHISVIKDYQYLDINNSYRFHLRNYFRKITGDFELDNNKKNILFTHADINIDCPPAYTKKFDKVIYGHIHDFFEKDNLLQLGAIRKCTKAESRDKNYLEIIIDEDKIEYILHPFESIIDIKEIRSDEIDSVIVEKPTILKVLTIPSDNLKEIENKISKWDWKENVIVKFEKYVSKNDIEYVLNEVDIESFNIKEIFKNYVSIFNQMFGDKIDYKLYENELCNYYENVNKDNDVTGINKLNFIKIEAENFKTFKGLTFNFNNYSNFNIVGVDGINKDEFIDEDNPSNNGSGKSNLRRTIEYVLLGSKNPLSYGQKKGYVKLTIQINNDLIELNKIFTKSKNDLFIKINNIEFHEKETNTDKLKLFFEKYKIENALQFIIISDVGLAKYFFSSKSNEKFKMFSNIFPVLENIDILVNNIFEDSKELNNKKELLESKINNENEKRKLVAVSFWKDYFKLNNEKFELKKEKESIRLQLLDHDKLELDYNEKEKIIFQYHELQQLLQSFNADEFELFNFFKYDFNFVSNLFKDFNANVSNLTRIEEGKNYISNLSKEFDDLISEIKKIEDNIASLNGKKSDIESLNILDLDLISLSKKKELKNKYEKNEISLDDLSFLRENHNKLNNDIFKEDISRFENEIKELENKIGNNNFENKICEVCGSNIVDKEKYIKHLQSEKDTKEDLLTKAIKSFDEIENKKIRYNQIFNSLDDAYFVLNNYNFEEYKKLKDEVIDNLDLTGIKENQVMYEKLKVQIFSLENTEKNFILKKNNILDNINKVDLNIKQMEEKAKSFNRERYKEIIELIKSNGIDKESFVQKLHDFEGLREKSNKLGFKLDVNLRVLLKKFIEDFNSLKNKVQELRLIKNDFDNKNSILNKIEKEISLLYLSIRESNKKYSIKKLDKEYKDMIIKNEKIIKLDNLLRSKKKLNFKTFFINHFFGKFKNIYDLFLKIMFSKNIELNVNEGKFNFIDIDKNELEFLDDFSAGEQKKLEVSMLLVLNILFSSYGVKSQQLFIDEFLDSALDNVNMERIFYTIKKFFSNKNIFVVSHKDIEKFKDYNIIIEKQNGVSNIL